jgi:nicotinamide-nucleotide amidase
MEKIARLAECLITRKFTISTAESCTGGLIAKCFTDLAGSSAWFESGVVSYSNKAKEHFLKVPHHLIKDHGAVSAPVALKMAEGVRAATNSTLSVATSGIAGPGGGSKEKPVGTVCFGFCFTDRSFADIQYFTGSRQDIRNAALAFVLDVLLTNLEP